jgi:tetratricopeptide (TPR) repeat protein
MPVTKLFHKIKNEIFWHTNNSGQKPYPASIFRTFKQANLYRLKKKQYILLFCLFMACMIKGQERNVDSLINSLKTEKSDTSRVWTLNYLAAEYKRVGIDSAMALNQKAIALCKSLEGSLVPEIELTTLMARAYAEHQRGVFAYIKTDYFSAILYYEDAISFWEKAGRTAFVSRKKAVKSGIVKSIGNLGLVYKEKGDYPKALEYLLRALKINEELNNKSGIAANLINIALIYAEQKDAEKALDYSLRSLKIMEELGNQGRIASVLGNIGTMYDMQDKHSLALKYCLRALEINKKLGNKQMIGVSLSKIGGIYYGRGDSAIEKNNKELAFNFFYPKAMQYYKEALAIAESENNPQQISVNCANIGSLYFAELKYKEAIAHLERALEISEKAGAKNESRQHYKILHEMYKRQGNHLKALESFEKFYALNEAIFAEEKQDELVKKEMNFNFEKKEAATKAEQEKKDAINLEEKKKQAIIRNFFIVGFSLVFLLALIILRGYRNKQKANLIIMKQKEEVEAAKEMIEHQKQMVEEKQKEIVDSIYYASRIQKALITNENSLQKILHKFKK